MIFGDQADFIDFSPYFAYDIGMSDKTWWDYYSEDPHEQIGRQVPGMFGEPITVCLDRIFWAYLDWIKEHLNIDINRFFADVERRRRPKDGTRDQVFAWAVIVAFAHHEVAGKPRPPWCPPVDPDYIDMLDGLEKRE